MCILLVLITYIEILLLTSVGCKRGSQVEERLYEFLQVAKWILPSCMTKAVYSVSKITTVSELHDSTFKV
jgi:hypothetical protein